MEGAERCLGPEAGMAQVGVSRLAALATLTLRDRQQMQVAMASLLGVLRALVAATRPHRQ